MGQHVGQERASEDQRRHDVQLNRATRFFKFVIEQPAELAATRVVDQEIDADLPCARDDSLATLIGAEVSGQTGDGSARSGQPGAHLLEPRLVAADQQQARRGGQGLGECRPDAARCAGDERHSVRWDASSEHRASGVRDLRQRLTRV